MESLKNTLANIFLWVGFICMIIVVLCITVIAILCLINKITGASKVAVLYQTCKGNKEIYDLRDKVVVSKNGYILYNRFDLDEQCIILKKGLKYIQNVKDLSGK